MLRYPTSLPLFEMGWSATPKVKVLESAPERGPSKRRRLTTAKTDVLSGTCRMDAAQLATFVSFWEDSISDGIDSFEYPDFAYSQKYRAARFKGAYTFVRESEDTYRLSVELELLP